MLSLMILTLMWHRMADAACCRCPHEATCQTPGPLCGPAAVLRPRCQQSSSKFRILGLLTASASAAMPQAEEITCEFCGGDRAGQVHIAEECPIFQDLRDQPETVAHNSLHSLDRRGICLYRRVRISSRTSPGWIIGVVCGRL